MSKFRDLARSSFVFSLCVTLTLIGAIVTTEAAPPHSDRGEPKAVAKASVDVNTATETDLTTVPGIGTSLAKRIIEFREQNGPFAKVDDLLKVRGIGEKSIEKLRPYLTVSKAK